MDDEAVLAKLVEMGSELPPVQAPVASYVPAVRSGSVVYVSAQVPLVGGEMLHPGHVGAEVSLAQAQEAARRCALQALAALRSEAGSLDAVARIVKLSVFVASAPGFTDQPKVANGASDLLAEACGDAGRHAREAIGVGELPLGAPVEVSMIAELSG
jgi:enamine deaminase RidA (YjgF/YER057c/UK114 family)